MDIFLTGATGYIGSVVAEKLQKAGHQVIALVRTEKASRELKAKGYETVLGELSNAGILEQTAKVSDGVIHTAQMRFDFTDNFMTQMKQSTELQLSSVTAMLKGLGESGKPFIITGGTGAYRDTGNSIVDEDTPIKASPMIAGLAKSEASVLGSKSVRGMAIRPGIVFGRGGGPVSQVLATSKTNGKVEMNGSGNNALSLVHVEDVADLYVLMLEKAKAGTLLNAVAEPFLTQKEVLEAVSKSIGYDGKVIQKNKLWEQVMMLIGKGSYTIFGNTMRVSAARAKALGWNPRSATKLLDELQNGSYKMS